jgi:hypothetical protein
MNYEIFLCFDVLYVFLLLVGDMFLEVVCDWVCDLDVGEFLGVLSLLYAFDDLDYF